jgi:acetyltransferase-like isoleucine patch superfamily enzyme
MRKALRSLPPAHDREDDQPAPALELPAGLSMGRHSHAVPRVIRWPSENAQISVGAFCSINSSAQILAGGLHHHEWVTSFAMRVRLELPGQFEDGHPWSKGDVVIGNDVWIGLEALVMSGVTIGHGAVVGARAVVTHDIPPYAVVAGVPARVIKYRFPVAERVALQRIAWWDWSDEKVIDNVDLLCSPRIAEFIELHLEETQREAKT